MENENSYGERQEREASHVIPEASNPLTYGHTITWLTVTSVVGLCIMFVGVYIAGTVLNQMLSGTFFLIENIIKDALLIICMIVMFLIYASTMMTEASLDTTIKKTKLRYGKKSSINKFDCAPSAQKLVKNITNNLGMLGQEGLSFFDSGSVGSRFDGNWAFAVVATPPNEMSKESYNKTLKNIDKSLPPDYLKKEIYISGKGTRVINPEIKERLRNKDLTESQRQALQSYHDKFSEFTPQTSVYIIHIGLPYTTDTATAMINMDEVRNGYEKNLNVAGIGTVLIKTENQLSELIHGMFTGDVSSVESFI